jgi:hypothetical protein
MPQAPVVACGNTAGNNCVVASNIYNYTSTFTQSGNNPTFNIANQ